VWISLLPLPQNTDIFLIGQLSSQTGTTSYETLKQPCSVAWDKWPEGEKVRFCNQCNLNVHNLSGMSDEEVKDLLANKNERVCIFMYQRRDGTVVTDNCPVVLRAVRNRIKATTAALFLVFSLVLGRVAHAQGLIVAPIEPHYGGMAEVGSIEGCGIGASILRFVTALKFMNAFFVPLSKHKRSNLKVIILEFVALAALPVFVYFVGQYILSQLGWW
jgi:hypothetical protein